MPQRNAAQHAGLYASELRLSLRNNSGAYGYSVMITGVMATLSGVNSPPTTGRIFLFLTGAVVSFAVVEAIATRGFKRSLTDEEQSTVVALGSSLSIVSISLAVGAAALVGTVLPDLLGWLVGSFVGSVVFLLMSGFEMGLARKIEEWRGVD